MLQKVAVVLMEDVALFEFGVLAEVFGIDRTGDGVPPFDFKVCSTTPGRPMDTSTHSQVIAPYGLEELEDADLIGIPATTWRHEYDERILEALRRAEARGAILLTVCSGVYVLGAAGLLDGRPCTTHWRYTEGFQRQFPTAKVDPDVLFVDNGRILTSAGGAAGIDLCLHLLRLDHGAAVASAAARRCVVAPWREGGQAQFIEHPVPQDTDRSTSATRQWALDRLAEPITLEDMARHAHMSVRTFTRRFRSEVGSSPLKWLAQRRLEHARLLLESTDLTVARIASACGFGDPVALRKHFYTYLGLSPLAYRRAHNAPEPTTAR